MIKENNHEKCILSALLIASVLSSSVSCQNAAPTHNDQPYNSTTVTEVLPAGNESKDYAGDRTQSLNIATGRSLFNLIASDNLHVHRDAAVDFGILPYPKFDLTQDRYYALDWSGLLCVPAAVTEKNMIGEAVELLGYYSAEEVIPTYYDIVLGSKLSRDGNPREMLGIIFDSIVFDAALCYFGFENYTGQFRSLADQILSSSWSGYASFPASYEAGASAEFAKLNDIVSSLE